MQAYLSEPFPSLIEGRFIRNIEDDQRCICQIKVVVNNGSVSLMACGVPKLQAVGLAHVGHCFSENIDADCLFVELVVVGGVFEEDGGLAD